ncbi:hypothetical protein [Ruminococcus sp. Marseille-P6503]|uniref:hypothetical protein n=1 Tax=Ruminococcus sp. Marseille-P6503 TaxID=2364796 RepID=UPI000F53F044|nr:hypothetical protein [Ruminococcus sp. Marseille-P6503]
MAIETGIYGEVTIRHELAHGIYQLVLAAGKGLRALIIGKDFAQQVLSQTALAKADEYDENNLGYPEQDGRMSIPMYELNQKGLLNLPFQEAKAHFNNLVHLIPDYLRARGILKEKPLPDIQTKLADEARQFEKQLSGRSKKDLIASAEEILNFNKIKDIIGSSEFPLRNQGLLIAAPNLVKSVQKTLHELNLEINEENVQKVCGSFDEAVKIDNKVIEDALSDIRSELERTFISRVKTVVMQITIDGKTHDLALSVQNFEKMLLTDEIKCKFAKAYMLDFPVPDYYGQEYKWLYESLFLKRFGENVQEYWERFAPQGENVQLHLKALSTEIAVTDSYSDLRNIAQIKGYLQSAYEKPERYIESLMKSDELEAHKKTINEIQQLIDQAEQTSSPDNLQADRKPAMTTEPAEIKKSAMRQSDIEFVKKEVKKRKPTPESRKMLNKARIITAQEAESLSETLIKERIERPGSNRVMYVLNKQKPNEVIRLYTNYDDKTKSADIVIQSYDSDQLYSIHDITPLSESDFKDYLGHLTKPVVMTEAAYKAYSDQRLLEQATKFEKEVNPFIQKEPLPQEAVEVIISDIAIESVDEIINETIENRIEGEISAEANVSDIQPYQERITEEIIEEEMEFEIG